MNDQINKVNYHLFSSNVAQKWSDEDKNIPKWLLLFITAFKMRRSIRNKYPMSSSGDERLSALRMLYVSAVCGPRPSWALTTAVNAWAAIP